MDDKQLEEIWDKMVQETFEKFSEEYLGYDPQSKGELDCYGSGDNHEYCKRCLLQESC